MTATVSIRRAAPNAGAFRLTWASRSRLARRARRVSSSRRVDRRIWSRVTGILSFGPYSGTVIRALFGRTRRHARRSMPLTKRQSEILSYLQGHIHGQGYAPSFEEIAEHFGF